MKYSFDLPGKVRNTRLYATHWLKPVFEAVSNSIQAIQDAEEPNGRIEVTILRDEPQASLLPPEPNAVQPISGFQIVDNGVGFTKANQKSFFTAESRYKADRGCKGVGRFLWLKAFTYAEIDSTFDEQGKRWRRQFRFVRTDSGVANESCVEAEKDAPRRTTIRLVSLRSKYKDQPPKGADIIAQRLVDFCLPQLANGQAPQIILNDADGTPYDLNAIFEEMNYYKKPDEFEVGEKKFKITHLLVPASKEQTHRVHLCANGWSVKPESLVDRMPELRTQPTPIRDLAKQGRQLFYTGFVTGKLLDQWVSDERIDFAWDDAPNMFSGDDGVTKATFMDAAVERINAYLSPHLTEIREQRDKQVKAHVADRSPQYRPLLKHRPELLKDIPPNLPVEKLELKLYEANQKYNVELKEEYHRLLEAKDAKAVDIQEHQARVAQFLEEWNEEGMAKLAWHVGHRQATLNFLQQELEHDTEENYRLEDAVHGIIFPMRATSDDIRWDRQNLWIIDEKLAYHFYLASDLQMKKVKAQSVDSQERMDLVVFNRPIAVVDSKNFESIVIFEFKRAMRDDYTDGDNPILQVVNYVKKLKGGREVDPHGRPIQPRAGTAYYGYIICDPSEKLDAIAENFGLKSTPDGKGFFGYHQTGVYLEVIYFDKLLNDARRRNQMLFDYLGCKEFPQPSSLKPKPKPPAPAKLKAPNAKKTQSKVVDEPASQPPAGAMTEPKPEPEQPQAITQPTGEA